MSKLKHTEESNASTTQADLSVDAQESGVMDLMTRINSVARHLIDTKRVTQRTWRRAMAEAAGCSYQNIYYVSKGEQHDMEPKMLKAIAAWAGVAEKYVLDGVGPMFAAPGSTEVAQVKQQIAESRETLSPLGGELARELDTVPDGEKRRRAFVAALTAISQFKDQP